SVKIVSPDILHKSDIGGAVLDVPAGEEAVRAAYQAVSAAAPDGARIDGVLVSPMRRGGTELLVGVVRDPQWGPVLAVAIGGLFVEVLQDSAPAPLPVTPGQAGRLLDRLRGRAVLDGVRGAAPADRDAQLTWIDEQTGGRPYGVDLLVPEKFATGDPGNLVASLRAQIPDEHLAFVAGLLDRYGIPDVPGNPEHDEIAAGLNPDGA